MEKNGYVINDQWLGPYVLGFFFMQAQAYSMWNP